MSSCSLVEDRIGERGVTDGLVPVLHGKLAGNDGGAHAVAVIHDLEQIGVVLPLCPRSQRKMFLPTRLDTRRPSGLSPQESILRSFEAGSGTPALIRQLTTHKLTSLPNVPHWSD